MDEEMLIIKKNTNHILIDKPQGRNIIGVKWVFRTKLNADGSINKYKARLVAKEHAQIFGVDYSDAFSLVTRLETIRLLLAVTVQRLEKFLLRCQICIIEWCPRGEDICGTTRWFHSAR